jgi:carbonic anhydrase/acetyltransferase-like protein (isoleucine patch superfamily)
LPACGSHGANALVPEGREIPSGQLALGTPVQLRPLAGKTQAEWIDFGVAEYVANAQRYRRGLQRIDEPDLRGGTDD